MHQAALSSYAEEGLYQSVLASSIDGFLLIDIGEGRILEANEAYAQMSGYPLAELPGKRLTELDAALAPWEIAVRIDQIKTNGRTRFESIHQRKDGTRYEVEVSAQFLAHQPARIASFVRDISADKAYQRLVELSRSLLSVVNDAVFIIDPVSRQIIDINETAVTRLGYSPGELLRLRIEDIDPGMTAEAWPNHVAEVLREGSLVLETRNRRHDGSTFPVEVNVRHFSTGDRHYLVAAARDITHRERSERALQNERQQLLALFEGLEEPIFVADSDTQELLFTNQTFRQTFGSGGPQRKCHEALHDSPDPCPICPSRKKSTHPGQHTVSWEMQSSRNRRWYRCSNRAIHWPGRTRAHFELALDITAQRQAENELRGSLADLERSNQHLQQFAFAASHDLEEPIDLVNTALERLAAVPANTVRESQQAIALAKAGIRQIHQMVKGLHAYTRITTREDPLEETSAQDCLDEVLGRFKAQIEETRADIQIEPLPMVQADPTQLALVFQHLLDNALTFRGPKPPRIQFSARAEGAGWIFQCRDNGIGIPAQHQERIFGIFQRLPTHQTSKGTGIGLALCRRIIERHGGTIWVESVPGQGSTFTFTLKGVTEAFA